MKKIENNFIKDHDSFIQLIAAFNREIIIFEKIINDYSYTLVEDSMEENLESSESPKEESLNELCLRLYKILVAHKNYKLNFFNQSKNSNEYFLGEIKYIEESTPKFKSEITLDLPSLLVVLEKIQIVKQIFLGNFIIDPYLSLDYIQNTKIRPISSTDILELLNDLIQDNKSDYLNYLIKKLPIITPSEILESAKYIHPLDRKKFTTIFGLSDPFIPNTQKSLKIISEWKETGNLFILLLVPLLKNEELFQKINKPYKINQTYTDNIHCNPNPFGIVMNYNAFAASYINRLTLWNNMFLNDIYDIKKNLQSHCYNTSVTDDIINKCTLAYEIISGNSESLLERENKDVEKENIMILDWFIEASRYSLEYLKEQSPNIPIIDDSKDYHPTDSTKGLNIQKLRFPRKPQWIMSICGGIKFKEADSIYNDFLCYLYEVLTGTLNRPIIPNQLSLPDKKIECNQKDFIYLFCGDVDITETTNNPQIYWLKEKSTYNFQAFFYAFLVKVIRKGFL